MYSDNDVSSFRWCIITRSYNCSHSQPISESDTVILAYGAYAKRPVVIERVEQVLEMLKPHKKKVKKLINPATNEIMHPLNPKARQKWTLK